MSRYHKDRTTDAEPITWPTDHDNPDGNYWMWQANQRSRSGRNALATASKKVQAQAQAILNATTTAKDRHAAWAAVGQLLGRKL